MLMPRSLKPILVVAVLVLNGCLQSKPSTTERFCKVLVEQRTELRERYKVTDESKDWLEKTVDAARNLIAAQGDRVLYFKYLADAAPEEIRIEAAEAAKAAVDEQAAVREHGLVGIPIILLIRQQSAKSRATMNDFAERNCNSPL